MVRLDERENSQPLKTAIPQRRSDRAILQRVRKIQHSLGAYRRDLLVALRVVNRIEHETIEIEWSKWLLGESVRCRQLSIMIEEAERQDNPSRTSLPSSRWNNKTLDEARNLRKGYCKSCITAQALESRQSLNREL